MEIEIIEEINKKIECAKNITILMHEYPDGDSIGSALGMFGYIKDRFNKKDVQILGKKIPEAFLILENINEIKEENAFETIDLVIIVDLHNRKRLYDYEYLIDIAKDVIVIDHHLGEPDFPCISLVDSTYPAACQMVYEILRMSKYDPPKKLCIPIITGILTDTGGFRYRSVNKRTFEIAGEILEKGVEIHELYRKFLDTDTENEVELKRLALERREYYLNGRILFTYLDGKDKAYVNMKPGENRCVNSALRKIKGVEVTLFMIEVEDGYKLSVRTEGEIRANEIAKNFNGDGHKNAAGAKIYRKNFEKIKQDVIEAAINEVNTERR